MELARRVLPPREVREARQSCAFQVSSLEHPKMRPLTVQTGQCKNFACDDVAPSPGLGKRIVSQKHLIERVCPAGFEPCPISSKGYEVCITLYLSAKEHRLIVPRQCIDFMNDIESCGGCVGENMPGVDCSADLHAADVSCVDGECVIGTRNLNPTELPANSSCFRCLR